MRVWTLCILFLTGLLIPGHAATYDAKGQEVRVTGTELWACHVPERSAKILEVLEAERKGRKYLVYRMSRDYKTMDTLLAYARTSGDNVAPFPTFYIYDTDRDGKPDTAYADEMGNGICQQMTKVPVESILSANHDKEA
jgi:hypothetical protein